MAANLPPCPPSLKPIAHFLKMAQEHDERDPVVAYWSRLYGLQTGLKISTKQATETALLIGIMEWLETFKKQHHDNESITNEVVAQAYLENYALKLFTYADQQDRAAVFNKNVVKAYYTAGIVYDILLTFGELSEEAIEKRKYAKYKAAYIHNCLKNGETPIPGPPNENADDDENANDNNADAFDKPNPEQGPSTSDTTNDEPKPSDQPNNDFFQNNLVTPDVPTVNADKLPSPPVDPEIRNPGGFQPFVPTAYSPVPRYDLQPNPDLVLSPDQMAKAQKYCKYAGSALNFDDVKSAIENLEKALHLLKTGKEL